MSVCLALQDPNWLHHQQTPISFPWSRTENSACCPISSFTVIMTFAEAFNSAPQTCTVVIWDNISDRRPPRACCSSSNRPQDKAIVVQPSLATKLLLSGCNSQENSSSATQYAQSIKQASRPSSCNQQSILVKVSKMLNWVRGAMFLAKGAKAQAQTPGAIGRKQGAIENSKFDSASRDNGYKFGIRSSRSMYMY